MLVHHEKSGPVWLLITKNTYDRLLGFPWWIYNIQQAVAMLWTLSQIGDRNLQFSLNDLSPQHPKSTRLVEDNRNTLKAHFSGLIHRTPLEMLNDTNNSNNFVVNRQPCCNCAHCSISTSNYPVQKRKLKISVRCHSPSHQQNPHVFEQTALM